MKEPTPEKPRQPTMREKLEHIRVGEAIIGRTGTVRIIKTIKKLPDGRIFFVVKQYKENVTGEQLKEMPLKKFEENAESVLAILSANEVEECEVEYSRSVGALFNQVVLRKLLSKKIIVEDGQTDPLDSEDGDSR